MKVGTPGPQFHYDFGDPSVNLGTPYIHGSYLKDQWLQ